MKCELCKGLGTRLVNYGDADDAKLQTCIDCGGTGNLPASKPPAPGVVETPMTDAALRDWRLEHYDRRLEMVAQESRTLERSLTAAQLEIERLKADVAKLEKQLARTPTRCNEEQRK